MKLFIGGSRCEALNSIAVLQLCSRMFIWGQQSWQDQPVFLMRLNGKVRSSFASNCFRAHDNRWNQFQQASSTSIMADSKDVDCMKSYSQTAAFRARPIVLKQERGNLERFWSWSMKLSWQSRTEEYRETVRTSDWFYKISWKRGDWLQHHDKLGTKDNQCAS